MIYDLYIYIMNFVFNICNTGLGLFLLNDYFQRNYREKYQEVLYNHALYQFS